MHITTSLATTVLACVVLAATAFAQEGLDPGAVIWNAPFGENYTWSTPLVVDDKVIIQDQAGGIAALQTSDGTQLWHTTGSGFPTFSPIYANGAIFMQSGGVVYRIAPDTGAIETQRDLGGDLQTQAPAAYGDLVFVSSYLEGTYTVYALNQSDLSDSWSKTFNQASNIMAQAGYIYVLGEDITCLAAQDGSEVWSVASPVTGMPLLQGALTPDYLAVTTNYSSSTGPAQVHLYSLDSASPETEAQYLWSDMLGTQIGGNPPTASADGAAPAFDNNMLFTTSRNGEIHAYSVSGNGTPAWKYTVRSYGMASALPAAADGKVLVQADVSETARQLVCLDGATGAVLWTTAIDSMGIAWSQPAIKDNVVYLALDHENGAYAIDATGVDEDWPMFKHNPQQTGSNNAGAPPVQDSSSMPGIIFLLQ